nr:hypothetical protein [Tanacetum cinerariifolium]
MTGTQTPPPATTVMNSTSAPVTNTMANHAERPEKFNDPLYNMYCKTMTANELWESLERKYKTEDAGTKKFVVVCFLDYKMVDSKNVISQGACYNYDQPGQRAANCKMPKRVNPPQANMVNDDVDMIATVSDVCTMISE